MTTLTRDGEITYNGFSFNGPRVRTSMEIRPIEDDAGRTTSYSLVTVQVDAVVTDNENGKGGTGGDAAAVVGKIQNLLTKQGGALTITGLGYRDLTVNTTSSDRDVKYGPKTKLLRIKPIAGIGAFEISWVVEVAVALCGTNAGSFVGIVGRFIAFNTSLSYSVDQGGYTTRSIVGYYQIVLNRSSATSQKISKTADDYREQVKPLIPPGFQRVQNDWSISADKSRMDFTLVDREMQSDNPYPDGIVDAQMSHRVSQSQANWAKTFCTISGFMTASRVMPMGIVWEKVLLLLRERAMIAKKEAQGAILLGVDLTEEIFSKRLSFSFQYVILGTGPRHITKHAGLFTEFDELDWKSWGKSLEETAWHPRGTARLKFTPGQDQIVDACNPEANTKLADTGQFKSDFEDGRTITHECPPREKSYIAWSNVVGTEQKSDFIEVKKATKSDGVPSRTTSALKLEDGTTLGTNPDETGKDIIVQGLGPTSLFVTLRGHCVRVGHKPEIPRATEAWGKEPKMHRVGSRVNQSKVTDLGECPVYAANWQIRYVVSFDSQDELQQALQNLDAIVVETEDDQEGTKINAKK